MQNTYSYTDLAGKLKQVTLSEEDSRKANQAMTDYASSKKYVMNQQYDIWRYALKAYHLSTFDRQTILKSWQQNIAVGMVRAFVDVLVSAVEERPLTFLGTPINKQGYENKENILRSLNYISDVTGFHTTIKESLKNGLILGTICMRVNYLKTEKKTTVTSIIDGAATKVVVEVNEEDVKDYPCASAVPIFNIFPDPYSGKLRNITERAVISHYEFKEMFLPLINRKDNTSGLKAESLIDALPIFANKNASDFYDYGQIVNQIHQKVNEDLRSKDRYSYSNNTMAHDSANTANTADADTQVTEGLIECLYTVYDDRIILHANRYPVYVGPNPFGFIPYVIKAAGDSRMRFGEGVPYMLRGLEETSNSFVNNYFDGARALATPTFAAVKNLLINSRQLESGQPGGVVWMDGGAGRDTIFRVDKGQLSDFGINDMITNIAKQITGISEYNLGQSAGERTASGALAVTQSSQKRMSPYISTFVDAVSVVAGMWLSLIKKNWTEERFIYVLDEAGTQTFESMRNDKLLGGINLSLQAEGLFGSTNELELQKILGVYNTLKDSGFANSPEIAVEIMKKAGFDPARFITTGGQMKPDAPQTANMGTPVANPGTVIENPTASLGEITKDAANPQIDLGNQGQ